METEYQDIISQLQILKDIRPREEFQNSMQKLSSLISNQALSTKRFSPMPLFAMRMALAVFVLLLIGGTTVAAASQSKPGDLLFPLKKTVEQVTITLSGSSQISNKKPENNPSPVVKTISPAAVPTVTPTVIPQTIQPQTIQTVIPTITSSPTTTPTPSIQQTSQVQAQVQLQPSLQPTAIVPSVTAQVQISVPTLNEEKKTVEVQVPVVNTKIKIGL